MTLQDIIQPYWPYFLCLIAWPVVRYWIWPFIRYMLRELLVYPLRKEIRERSFDVAKHAISTTYYTLMIDDYKSNYTTLEHWMKNFSERLNKIEKRLAQAAGGRDESQK